MWFFRRRSLKGITIYTDRVDIHVSPDLTGLEEKVDVILTNEQDTMTKLGEIDASLTHIDEDIAALKAAIAANVGSVPQDVIDAVDALVSHASSVDADSAGSSPA